MASHTIDPPPARWQELALCAHARKSPHAHRFREQLGLPTDGPLVVTGHQPILFHPGILAKFIAADAAAEALGTPLAWKTAWVVADQDTPDISILRRPVRDADGVLRVEHARLTESPVFSSIAIASQPPLSPAELRPPFDQVARAFEMHADKPTLAAQAMGALTHLMTDLVPPAPTFFASHLHKTDLFGLLLDAMAQSPEACAQAYNHAAAEHPEARLRPLAIQNNDPELPLWQLQPGQPREPVFASQLASIPREQLAPRAKLLDAIVRLGGADLFIHGTGGRAYSRSTDHWLAAWNPIVGCEALAPVVTVSATRTIDTGPAPTSPAQADRAVWTAHHARHTPELLGNTTAQEQKLRLVREIEASPRRSEARASLFAQLTGLLDQFRNANSTQLAALDGEAANARERSGEHHIASDRTWPFPVYPVQALGELAEAIRAEFE